MPANAPTRGFGILEGFLAHRRYAQADALIPEQCRNGAIVDLACGVPPLFLEHTRFAHKHGMDMRIQTNTTRSEMHLMQYDVCSTNPFPFADASADVVTMLATVEHIPKDTLPMVFREVLRILRPGGILVITTPAWWTGPLLTMFSWMRMVSRDEIEDHRQLLSQREWKRLLVESGFGAEDIRTSTFECGMNTWVTAHRDAACPAQQSR